MNATAIGILAILMWALLALLTASAGNVPPFQLLALTMAVGALAGMITWPVRRFDPRTLHLPGRVWMTGILGLFGYHFFYFAALRNAPAAPASLIAYLWPMLIVVGSALLPGERLRWYHLFGAALGLSGAALLLLGGGWHFPHGDIAVGFASAFLCALIWSSYSILSRAQKSAPSDAVAVYCLAAAVMAAICHLLIEETVWPQGIRQWAAVLALGLMPVGLAFYAWDHGVKHGNIQFLGGAAYLAPLLSTLILVAGGLATASASLAVACLLIVAGAVIASGRLPRAAQPQS